MAQRMPTGPGEAVLRIGEVARRTGVSVSALRAWERRYGLLEPERTEGGHRLYSEHDVRRVLAMQVLLDEGWTASAAASEVSVRRTRVPTVVDDPVGAAGDDPATILQQRLRTAIDRFDSHELNTAIDDVFVRFDVGTALERVMFPVLRWLGEGWEKDPRVIAREHFATNALRQRLLRFVRSTAGASRVAVAAAPPREEHDVGLLGAAAVLSTANWSVRYLGPNTPMAVLAQACAEADADVALVASVEARHAQEFADEAPDLGRTLLVLGGVGFDQVDVDGAAHLRSGAVRELPTEVERLLQVHHERGTD